MNIVWLGHASFLIETQGKNIYIDPYFEAYPYVEVDYPKADLILISHWHFSHCTSESVKKIRKDSTVIFGTGEAASQFFGCNAVRQNKTFDLDWVKVTAMPAKLPRGEHKEDVLGWLLEIAKKKIYYTSDTGFLESMAKIAPDVLLVPVGGTYTLNAREAAELTNFLVPKIAIPMHWGKIVGTRDDAELFRELVEEKRKVNVVILNPGEMIEV